MFFNLRYLRVMICYFYLTLAHGLALTIFRIKKIVQGKRVICTCKNKFLYDLHKNIFVILYLIFLFYFILFIKGKKSLEKSGFS